MALVIAGTFVLAVPAFAKSEQGEVGKNKVEKESGEKDSYKMKPNVVGKVTAINGNIITINRKQGSEKEKSATSTTPASTIFTIDATNAKILRGENTILVSNIAVGDNIVVQGTITGTNVIATLIRDGKMGNGNDNVNENNQAMLELKGNGQPVVAGKISVISGSTVTITNSGNVTYTIDATSAKIVQGKNTILVAGLKVGDMVIVQGTVNGTAITASTIIAQVNKPADSTNSAPNAEKKENKGFFGSFGQWLKNLFGF